MQQRVYYNEIDKKKCAAIIVENTFKVCPKCQVSKPLLQFDVCKMAKYGRGGYCKPCHKKINAERYTKQREKMIARATNWRKNNPEKHKSARRSYAEKNRGKLRDWDKKSRKRNADRIRVREAMKSKVRKAIISKTKFPITAEEWRDIRVRQRFLCFYCGIKPRILEMDHVMPLKRGGEHVAKNIVGACKSCNCKKQAKDPQRWAHEIGRLFV